MPAFDISTVDINSLLTVDDPFAVYPTEEALELINTFEGTPSNLVWLLRELWYGGEKMVSAANVEDYGEDYVEITFVTVGWSGNESLLGALNRTVFEMRFWESSHRGGKHVYRVRTEDWDKSSYLGDIRKHPGHTVSTKV